MKNLNLLLALFLLISLGLNAIENRDEAINFCYEVIDGFSPGSLHLLACLKEVDTLSKSGVSELEDFVTKICYKAPEFGIFGDEKEITQRCLNEAKEEGFIKKL